MPPAPTRRLRRLRPLALLALALGVGWLVSRQYRLFLVDGTSMEPGMRTGDLLVVARGTYRGTAPRRGDVVVARHEGDHLVKRVVGLPGERVAIRRGRLRVDGAPKPEPWDVLPGLLEIGEGVLGPDRVALAGDNRTPDAGIVHAVVGLGDLEGRVVAVLRWPVGLLD